MLERLGILTEDDGVNDEEACYQACLKLEAEGFWDDVKRRMGLKSSIVSEATDRKHSGASTGRGRSKNQSELGQKG